MPSLDLRPIHIPNGCLVNIFIFEAVKGILLLFKHTTCPYYRIFNFANLSFSGSSVKSCLIFWYEILSVLVYFFLLYRTFISAAHNMFIYFSSCTNLQCLLLKKFVYCPETIQIFTDYYSVLKVDSLGSESGVLAFGS
jgi:hypothetical protein